MFIKQKYCTYIPCEHKPFWLLSQLSNITANQSANLLFLKNWTSSSFKGPLYIFLQKKVHKSMKFMDWIFVNQWIYKGMSLNFLASAKGVQIGGDWILEKKLNMLGFFFAIIATRL